MADGRVGACAAFLADLRAAGKQIPYLPPELKPHDEQEAYQIQFALHEILACKQGRRVGWKIGCTTKVMQDFLGIPSPCAGGMFEAGLRQSPASYAFTSLRHPGIECEIAVRLAADVPIGDAPYDRHTIGPFVGNVMAAMEVVEERFIDFRDDAVDAPSLIADDFFHVGAVVGPEIAVDGDMDLASFGGSTRIDDQVIGQGKGADVMGHPYAALAWLANHLAAFNLGLGANDVVLTGSVVATEFLPKPATAITEIDGLGNAVCSFTG